MSQDRGIRIKKNNCLSKGLARLEDSISKVEAKNECLIKIQMDYYICLFKIIGF